MSSFYADDRHQYKMQLIIFILTAIYRWASNHLLSPKTAEGGGIKGVWQGISMQTSASSGIRYNVYTPIFLSNGQAYFGPKFPSEGLNELDTRILPQNYTAGTGELIHSAMVEVF